MRTLSAAVLAFAPLSVQAQETVVSSSGQVVELSWSDSDKDHTKVALALGPEAKACSSVSLERDKRSTQVNVCRQSADADPLVYFAIERIDQSGPQRRSIKLNAEVKLRRGAKVVVGRFEPSDGPAELLATLR